MKLVIARVFTAIFVFGLLILTYRCTESTSECNLTSNRSLKVNFVTYTRNRLADTLVKFNQIVTASQYTLYDTAVAKQITLPLSQLSDTSEFYFLFDSVFTDTLQVFVQRNVEMVSPECGFNTFFVIDSVRCTKNKVEQVIVVDKTVGQRLNTDRNLNIVIKKKEP